MLARRERDGRVSGRLLALANALDGMSREAAARAAGMDRQTLRDWVHRVRGRRDGAGRARGQGRQRAGGARPSLRRAWSAAGPRRQDGDVLRGPTLEPELPEEGAGRAGGAEAEEAEDRAVLEPERLRMLGEPAPRHVERPQQLVPALEVSYPGQPDLGAITFVSHRPIPDFGLPADTALPQRPGCGASRLTPPRPISPAVPVQLPGVTSHPSVSRLEHISINNSCT
jgi:hypothetical protein